MADPLIRHVSDTAFLVAHHRAVESARPDALFADPLAGRLAGTRGRAIATAAPASAMTGWTVALRTVIIDEFIQQAIANGVDTIVNLGAGLDTRPYRLALPPALTWVEVDYPDLIAWKEKELAAETPRCRLERVPLDLADLPARRQLLARLDARAARMQVLTEGVVPYLDVAQVGALADDLRGLAHVDSWIVEYISPEATAYRKRRGADTHMRRAPFKFEPSDWFGFFASHGFREREIRYLAIEGAHRGRRAPLPWRIRLMMKLLRPFTPAEKRRRFARFFAYVVLAPADRGSFGSLD
jgi:methyltransferase (TIGR00027 family)